MYRLYEYTGDKPIFLVNLADIGEMTTWYHAKAIPTPTVIVRNEYVFKYLRDTPYGTGDTLFPIEELESHINHIKSRYIN